ncbi:hypothetical protein MAPG_03919 [Magnaporthiopsis poae ATCC 64411]|uniref:Uncharacterized protein n=1 Tax=Magnaporthiopsis poae (strain ATCC 64411 / 73-15) TaxID=644358 RepID=A0A0C4DVB7_MAGP6|nr:hypothetical protein MAPG_03919 [Magnaporthiopsis poae ATCC 64411]
MRRRHLDGDECPYDLEAEAPRSLQAPGPGSPSIFLADGAIGRAGEMDRAVLATQKLSDSVRLGRRAFPW